jgi:hypothetical protein
MHIGWIHSLEDRTLQHDTSTRGEFFLFIYNYYNFHFKLDDQSSKDELAGVGGSYWSS